MLTKLSKNSFQEEEKKIKSMAFSSVQKTDVMKFVTVLMWRSIKMSKLSTLVIKV